MAQSSSSFNDCVKNNPTDKVDTLLTAAGSVNKTIKSYCEATKQDREDVLLKKRHERLKIQLEQAVKRSRGEQINNRYIKVLKDGLALLAKIDLEISENDNLAEQIDGNKAEAIQEVTNINSRCLDIISQRRSELLNQAKIVHDVKVGNLQKQVNELRSSKTELAKSMEGLRTYDYYADAHTIMAANSKAFKTLDKIGQLNLKPVEDATLFFIHDAKPKEN